MTVPLLITHDLAVVSLRAWTIAGEILAEPTTALAALDDPDQPRKIHVQPQRRPWSPPQPCHHPFPLEPSDRLQHLADRIAPHVDEHEP